MNDSFINLISGRRHGPLAVGARGALRLASLGYRTGVGLRNHYYNALAMPHWLEVPVFSVGNLTVGGTGKTPMTVWLCRQLLDRGLKPAVLSRGYKASDEGLADELLLVSRQCPQAVAVAHPDRRAAGRLAIDQYHVQTAVLDDGFQHRRLGRDLDILLIDATRPFGFGYVLPRGLLREPIHNLRRAEAIVLTRADQASPQDLAEIESTIRWHNNTIPLVRAIHRPKGFVDLAGQPLSALAGGRIGALAGIARPETFERTLADLGLSLAERRRLPDHHVYTPPDVQMIRRWVEQARLDVIVTTEKDAVKLARLEADWPVPIAVLRIEIEMRDGGDKILVDLIDQTLDSFRRDMRPGSPGNHQ
ncbi:MAG TPA: tetraacyldisaccharide 4'-kinase [Phycisphaerae bacterium]|nr:tetraacyldisaccharide 4'-kinase [Phycisphaerae bacterium]